MFSLIKVQDTQLIKLKKKAMSNGQEHTVAVTEGDRCMNAQRMRPRDTGLNIDKYMFPIRKC